MKKAKKKQRRKAPLKEAPQGIGPEAEGLLTDKLKKIQRLDGRVPEYFKELLKSIWCLTPLEIQNLLSHNHTPMYVVAAINIVNETAKCNMHATAYFNDIVFARAQVIGGIKKDNPEDELLPPVTVFQIPGNGSEAIDAQFEKIETDDDVEEF